MSNGRSSDVWRRSQSAFLTRNAAEMLLRRRGMENTALWLCVFLLVAALGTAPLLLVFHRTALLAIAAAACGLFLIRSALNIVPAWKRFGRSRWAEILGVAALTLTAPAAYVVVTGTLNWDAWFLWAACTLYFAGGIFYVYMLLDAVRLKEELTPGQRFQLARGNLAYLLLLLGVLARLANDLHAFSACLFIAAFLPADIRTLVGAAKLSNKAPAMKRVGIRETFYALWFTLFLIASTCFR